MRVRFGWLRETIRRHLVENKGSDDVILSDGEAVAAYSEPHVKDMQSLLSSLEAFKKQHKYGSADRSKIASACSVVKKHVKRADGRDETLDEDDAGDDVRPPRTFTQEGELSPGRTGYGRGAMAPQVEPSTAMRKG